MNNPLSLRPIPSDRYTDYRYDIIFRGYKWDPQVEDQNTIANQVVILDRDTAEELSTQAEQLARETVQIEAALRQNLSLVKKLGLPREIVKTLDRFQNYNPENHVRLMRFDFHPTTEGWAISEVNSDVPGGFAEASIIPEIAAEYLTDYEPFRHAGDHLYKAFHKRLKNDATVAFVHATSYSDDSQVMQFLSDYFQERGMHTILSAPDHIKWSNKRAVSIIEGLEGPVDGIVRFFPLEWLSNLSRSANWQGYCDSETTSCNHPVAILTQSKRLPLVWDQLGLELPAWKRLLPATKEPPRFGSLDPDWIYKPALGRVGEDITVKGTVPQKELGKIRRDARWNPKDWVAQQMFHSAPLHSETGEEYHLCIGVFVIDGECAGFYGRVSPYPRIDLKARDIPVLVKKEGTSHER